jgi:CMP-N,N'-diacetyllegionaminic acid synthase
MIIMALIPARSGSKRVKDKNIRLLDGQPLLQWSVVSALFNSQIQKVVVSTDSEEYSKMAIEWGADVLIRPESMSRDDSGDWPVIHHALGFHPCDLLVYLRPTTPLRSDVILNNAINAMVDAGGWADSLRSVEEMGESAMKCFTVNPGPFLVPLAGSMQLANLPNQMVPPTFKGNGYIDIVKGSQVWESGQEKALWGDRCIGFITPRTIEIDSEDDLEYAEWWIQRKKARRGFGYDRSGD